MRPMFPSGPRGETYCALFDDFLSHHEFGLAFDVLCDFLLEPDAPPPTEPQFKEIALIHNMMELQDQYLLRLRDKIQNSRSTDNLL
jgi:hypothetical protein